MDGFSLCGPLTGPESTHKNKCHVLPVNSTNFHCYYLINVSASCFCEMLSAKQEFFTFFWSSHKASILTRRHGSFPLKSHMPHISLFEPLNHKSLLAFQIEGWINFVQMDWGRGLSALVPWHRFFIKSDLILCVHRDRSLDLVPSLHVAPASYAWGRLAHMLCTCS